MSVEIDRSAINRALAKAIAYHQAGKPLQAKAWAAELIALLGAADILRPDLTVSLQDGVTFHTAH